MSLSHRDNKNKNVVFCAYSDIYTESLTHQTKIFRCDQLPIGNKRFCIFHDEDYITEFKDLDSKNTIVKRFNRRLKNSLIDNRSLFCIGYHLPNIKIKENFDNAVYFHNAKFQKVDFSSCKFSYVDFSQAIFADEADFSYTVYSYESYFQYATFLGDVDFSDTKFSSVCWMFGTEFSSQAYFGHSKFLGETQFSRCIFNETSFFECEFSSAAYFSAVKFESEARFNKTTFSFTSEFGNCDFSDVADFSDSKFLGDADFSSTVFPFNASFRNCRFSGSLTFNETEFSNEQIAYFNSVIFDRPNDVRFDIRNMSHVSFLDTDVTGIRFSDKTTWGGDDGFRVIEEEWLENSIGNSDKREVSFGGVLSVYRNLRENYEFRRRYDEAGKFFIREMELKRKYRLIPNVSNPKLRGLSTFRAKDMTEDAISKVESRTKRKGWLRRNISLTGIYYHLSRYGEDLLRPSITGLAIVLLSTIFFVTQSDPYLIPGIPLNLIDKNDTSNTVYTVQPAASLGNDDNTTFLVVNSVSSVYAKYVGLDKILDLEQWQKALDRSLVAFIPLLPPSSEIKVSLLDYLIKIVGGLVIFGLIAIALRRRFERKYYH